MLRIKDWSYSEGDGLGLGLDVWYVEGLEIRLRLVGLLYNKLIEVRCLDKSVS